MSSTMNEIPHWQDHVAAGFGPVRAHRDALEDELGSAAATATIQEVTATAELKP